MTIDNRAFVSDILLPYYLSQREIFESNLQRAADAFDEEAIHDLRVALKKIRALFKILEFLDPQLFNGKSAFIYLRKIFKEAGILRDLQVQKGLFQNSDDPDELRFVIFLSNLEYEARIKFREFINRLNLQDLEQTDELIKTTLENMNQTHINAGITNFIMEKLQKVLSLMNQKNDTMHESRINLKDAYYILDLLKENQ
ncbi:MAG: CHAD domain-containing protein, partial [Bacteroidetes bacterium]|nr:CHAD domain-containing protein [Bacteroidota bacterium]